MSNNDKFFETLSIYIFFSDLTEDKPLKDSNVLDSPIQKKTSSDKKATVLDEVFYYL